MSEEKRIQEQIQEQKQEQIEKIEQIVEDHDLWDDINDYFHSKAWYKSKTILFNIAIAIATGAGSLLYDANFKEMVGSHYAVILTSVTIINVYLRSITNTSIK